MSKVVFIGGGNMASCLIGGMLANGFSNADILVSEPNAESRQRIEATHGISTTGDNGAAVSAADIVVLAVKPQVMGAVAAPLADSLTHNPIVVSIAAGIPVSALENWMGPSSFLRQIPECPQQLKPQ